VSWKVAIKSTVKNATAEFHFTIRWRLIIRGLIRNAVNQGVDRDDLTFLSSTFTVPVTDIMFIKD